MFCQFLHFLDISLKWNITWVSFLIKNFFFFLSLSFLIEDKSDKHSLSGVFDTHSSSESFWSAPHKDSSK